MLTSSACVGDFSHCYRAGVGRTFSQSVIKGAQQQLLGGLLFDGGGQQEGQQLSSVRV